MNLKQIQSDLETAAKSYKPRQRAWTAEETELAKRFYNRVGVRLLAEKLNRSVESVRSHMRRFER